LKDDGRPTAGDRADYGAKLTIFIRRRKMEADLQFS